jgi:TATA-box binding protein (TBP) (component of TFIID and TFIIIB)
VGSLCTSTVQFEGVNQVVDDLAGILVIGSGKVSISGCSQQADMAKDLLYLN